MSASLIFNKYEIVKRLAMGGMGEVFVARQTGIAGFDRLVILKNLLPDLAKQDELVNQFLDEARVAATLNHPNIVSILEVGEWEGVYYLAMEYIKGADLVQLQIDAYKKGKKIPISVAGQIIADSANGLDHAHHASNMSGDALNIVHRDISPHNIMIRTDGVAKVVDFGIAKAAGRLTRTATGMIKGKLHYMSPEQIQGQTITGATDQFALGVVLWEMLARKRLFKEKSDIRTYERIVACDIPALSSVNSEIPPEFEKIVMRMLAKDPAERYPRIGEAGSDLNRFVHLYDQKAGNQQVSDFLQEVFESALEDRAKAFLSDAGKFMKTPSQGTSSFKMANRSATGGPASAGSSASQNYANSEQNKSQTMRRPAPARQTSSATLVLAGALGATVFLALLVGVGFFFYQMGQGENASPSNSPPPPPVVETVDAPSAPENAKP